MRRCALVVLVWVGPCLDGDKRKEWGGKETMQGNIVQLMTSFCFVFFLPVESRNFDNSSLSPKVKN